MSSAHRLSVRLRIASVAVLVAVLAGLITPPSAEALSRPTAKTIATGLSEIPCRYALLASKGTTAVVAYLDGGALKTRRSLNAGVTWESARTIGLKESEGFYQDTLCVAVVATSTYFYLFADTYAEPQVDPACEQDCETTITNSLRFWRSSDGKNWTQMRPIESSSIGEFRVSANATQLFLAVFKPNASDDECVEDCPAETGTISVYETGSNNVVFGQATELVTDAGYYDDETAAFLLGGGSIATLTWFNGEGTSHMRSRTGVRNWRRANVLGANSEGVSASSGKSVFVGYTSYAASSFRWNISATSGSTFPRSKVKADSTYSSAQIRNVWSIGASYGVAVYRWNSIGSITDIYLATSTSATKRWSMRASEVCVGGTYVNSKVLVVARMAIDSGGEWVWDEDLEQYEYVEGDITYSLYSYTSAP
jgi:hypothetical protein